VLDRVYRAVAWQRVDQIHYNVIYLENDHVRLKHVILTWKRSERNKIMWQWPGSLLRKSSIRLKINSQVINQGNKILKNWVTCGLSRKT
jgi:hypothetical protein